MKSALIFTAGVLAGFLMSQPTVQRTAKESALNLAGYAKEQINNNFRNKVINKEETSYETEKPLEV